MPVTTWSRKVVCDCQCGAAAQSRTSARLAGSRELQALPALTEAATYSLPPVSRSTVSNRFVSLLTVSFSQDVAAKIHGMLKQHKLRRVFLATDSPDPRVFEDILREQVSESLLLLLR